MAEHDGKTEYIKSGLRRLRDAEELVQPPSLSPQEHGAETRHGRGAAYLAGYGVECLLKAYIIERHPPHTRLSDVRDFLNQSGQPIQDICASAGHKLGYLLSLTDLEGRMNDSLRQEMGICLKWKSVWRYDPSHLEDGITYVQACRSVVNWIQSQI